MAQPANRIQANWLRPSYPDERQPMAGGRARRMDDLKRRIQFGSSKVGTQAESSSGIIVDRRAR